MNAVKKYFWFKLGFFFLLVFLLNLSFLISIESSHFFDFRNNYDSSNIAVTKDLISLKPSFIDKREHHHYHYTFDKWNETDNLSSEALYQDLEGYYGKSLKFLYPNNAITLKDIDLDLLNPKKNVSSFKISFYFYNFGSFDNAYLMSAKDIIVDNLGSYEQGWNIFLEDNKLVCEFLNTFYFKDKVKPEIVLKGKKEILNDQWYKVEIAFNALEGKLVLYLNDQIADYQYITSNDELTGSIYYFELHSTYSSDIILGEKFSGKLDELSISTLPFLAESTSYREGYYISEIIPLKDSEMHKINFDAELGEEDIFLFYFRYSSRYFPPETDFIPWTKITSFLDFDNPFSPNFIQEKNSFYQFKIVLKERISKEQTYGDKYKLSNYKTKSISSLELVYRNLIRPVSISQFSCKQEKDDSIVLSWEQHNNPSQIKGYYVYYAKKSFQVENSKKITVSKNDIIRFFSPKEEQLFLQYTLPPLEKDEVYYFAITAFTGNEYILESPIVIVNSLVVD